MIRTFVLMLVFVLTVAGPNCAMGATDQEQRIKVLEEKLKALENQLQQLMKDKQPVHKEKESVQKKKGATSFTFWKNDFFLCTEDENFWMKIRGNLHFDSKFYGGNSNNPTEFDIRRARMDFQGMWYKCIYFRVQAEFADSPYIRNAWVDYKFSDWLHLRAGQMKPPFSTSWWTTDNNVNFLERGAGTPLYPYFDRGWWAWGEILDKTLTWNLSAFTGVGMENDNKYGDIDDHKDYVARLFYTPFKNNTDSIFQGLHLCIQGSLGKQSVPTTRFEKKGYGAAIRDDKFWTWETENPGSGTIDSRNRWGAELHYINGPFSMSSEYLVTLYDDMEVFATDSSRVLNEDGKIKSWSTWFSYFLTGEQKRVSNFGWKQPRPKENFDPLHLTGTGAWEILARYSNTRTSESLFETVIYAGDIYRILEGAPRVNECTLGLAWTWNPMVRWQINYVHLNGSDIRTGNSSSSKDTNRVDTEDMLGLRMIFKF